MDIRFQAGGPKSWKADVAVIFAIKGADPTKMHPEILEAAPWFGITPGLRDFNGEEKELATFYGHPDLDLPRVMVIGLGAEDKITPASIREGMAQAARQCRKLKLTSILVPATQFYNLSGGAMRHIEEGVFGALTGLYRYLRLKVKDTEHSANPLWLAIGFTESSVPDMAQLAARKGERAAKAVATARSLAITPPNLMNPKALAEEAETIAKCHKLQCKIYNEEELAEMGCNALLAVGQGSKNESRLIVLEYAPKGHEEDKPLVFIGKGITFDSGGISLKPAPDMHQMKADMTGAAAVLAAIDAIADEGMPRRVVAILASAENMPGGGAFRPGDVVRTMSGKTVEILNTDAEGRMVLCDALTYAQKNYTCAAIVDIATLTGACMIALGRDIGGLFSDDQGLVEYIKGIGEVVGEAFWPMPLWQPYRKQLKSSVADLSHMGPREGGAINAALFLKDFVNDGVRWAHLDIAGTDWANKDSALCDAGPTGFGVRTLIDLARVTL